MITVIGSSNTDMVVKTDRFPQPGETIIGGKFFLFAGGKGANQAVAAARLGGQVRFVARLGDDLFGRQAREGFEREGIDCTYVRTDPEVASGTALITVDASGENSIVVAPGANDRLSPDDLAGLESTEADILLAQLETPIPVITAAARLPGRFVLNPAPAAELPAELYANLYLITPNETEAELLTGIRPVDGLSLKAAAEVLRERGVANVIITLGSQGAFYLGEAGTFISPAPKVEAVDTTAAGDVFNGALCVALSEGADWGAAVKFAIRAASLSVTRMGPQASAPRRAEL